MVAIPFTSWTSPHQKWGDYSVRQPSCESQRRELKNELQEMARDIKVKMRREFDPSFVGDDCLQRWWETKWRILLIDVMAQILSIFGGDTNLGI